MKRQCRRLSAKDLAALVVRCQSDPSLFPEVLEAVWPLVLRWSCRFRHWNLVPDDVAQECVFAVYRCVRAFDPERGAFTTLLCNAMNNAARSLRRTTGVISVPGEVPVSCWDVAKAARLAKAFSPMELQDPCLVYEEEYCAEMDRKIELANMWRVLSGLSARYQDVLERRFIRGEKLREIAKAYGVTKERVRQLLVAALRRAKERAAGHE